VASRLGKLIFPVYIRNNVRAQVTGTSARIFDPEIIRLWPHFWWWNSEQV